jgi:NADH-quinone oxidoreductase subunit L
MFVGVGVGAYVASVFHLTTHAFFKALLFLCAGSVMHALAGELDIFRMGGLRKKMPWTFGTFLVGTLALAGVPLFSGFFSKDLILYSSFEYGSTWLWLLEVLTAGLTAFYAFRLLFVAFYGKTRLDRKTYGQVHESPLVMIGPKVILAALAFLAGYVGLPKLLGVDSLIELFLHPVLGSVRDAHPSAEGGALVEVALMLASVVAVAIGFCLAYWLYLRRWGLAARWTRSARWLYDVVYNKYYVDEAYTEAIVKPLRALGAVLYDLVEERTIDGSVNGLARLVGLLGEGVRRLQTGLVRNYALVMLAGAVAILAYFVARAVAGW